MKKTLVALAALAATGAFAQVTITGNLTMGYLQASKTTSQGAAASNTTDSSGLGVDTSEIDFAATEDLGGGWKAQANMALAGADRSGESGNAGVVGRNASLALTTPVGAVSLGSVRAGDYLSQGTAGVGALYYNMSELNGADGLFSARTRRDTLTYTLPVSAALTLAVSHQEGANFQALGTGSAGVTSDNNAQRLNAYIAKYTAGALVVDAQLLQFDQSGSIGFANAGAVAAAVAAKLPTITAKDEQRLSASYDLGAVKLGAGIQITNYTGATIGGVAQANPKKTQTLIGVAAPLGSLNLGLNWGQRKNDDFVASGAATQDGTQTGYGLAVSYSLSKRTAILAQYNRWDAAVNATSASTATGVLLSHSF